VPTSRWCVRASTSTTPTPKPTSSKSTTPKPKPTSSKP
jgi:hypothetical protein